MTAVRLAHIRLPLPGTIEPVFAESVIKTAVALNAAPLLGIDASELRVKLGPILDPKEDRFFLSTTFREGDQR